MLFIKLKLTCILAKPLSTMWLRETRCMQTTHSLDWYPMVSKSVLPDSFIAQWWIPQRLVMLFIISASQVLCAHPSRETGPWQTGSAATTWWVSPCQHRFVACWPIMVPCTPPFNLGNKKPWAFSAFTTCLLFTLFFAKHLIIKKKSVLTRLLWNGLVNKPLYLNSKRLPDY